jgi:peptidylprolyl isomerase
MATRRRWILVGGVGAIAVAAALLVLLLNGGGGSNTVKAKSTATTAALAKPCVPVADPLPAGAPAVPVKTGPAPTQLVKEDLKVGTGAVVGPTDTVTANYIGVACSTGKIFDSSYSRGAATPFPLTGVIKGWQDGIPGMKVGGQRLLGIPAAQAYGSEGRPPTIGPDEALWFVVEVVETKAS